MADGRHAHVSRSRSPRAHRTARAVAGRARTRWRDHQVGRRARTYAATQRRADREVRPLAVLRRRARSRARPRRGRRALRRKPGLVARTGLAVGRVLVRRARHVEGPRGEGSHRTRRLGADAVVVGRARATASRARMATADHRLRVAARCGWQSGRGRCRGGRRCELRAAGSTGHGQVADDREPPRAVRESGHVGVGR